MSEAYLRIRLKNARIAAGRYETVLSDLRVKLNRYVDLCLIEKNEIAHLEAMLEEMYDEQAS